MKLVFTSAGIEGCSGGKKSHFKSIKGKGMEAMLNTLEN